MEGVQYLFSNIPFLILMYHMHKAPPSRIQKISFLLTKPPPCVAMTSLQRQEGKVTDVGQIQLIKVNDENL